MILCAVSLPSVANAATTDFVFTWYDDGSTALVLPINLGSPGGASVDCGSGVTGVAGDGVTINTRFTVCNYGTVSAGVRTITVSNPQNMTFSGDICNGTCDILDARDILQWGNFTFRGPGYFYNAQSLTVSATDPPTIQNGISLQATFQNARALNSDFSGWDVSGVTNFDSMFAIATSFNQSLAAWNLSGAAGIAGNMYNMLSNTAISQSNLNSTFAGWAGSSWFGSLGSWAAQLGAGGRTYSDLASYTTLNAKGFTTTATYVAPTPVSITYNADGGTGTVPATGSYTPFGTPYTVASNIDLVKDGYDFFGWSTGPSGTGTIYQPGDSLTASVNVTLYANWVDTNPVPAPNAPIVLPAPWLQAYERPGPNASCVEGWNPSWAQWPADGRGGYTCEKSWLWFQSQSLWVSNAGFPS
jgi:surface protein